MSRWRWSRARSMAAEIRAAMADCREKLGEPMPAPPVERGVKRLVQLLRDDAAVAAAEERLRHRRALRLALGLRPFLGGHPMAALARSTDGGDAFETEIRRLAGLFLGRRAAACLLERHKPDLGATWGGD